MPKIEVKTIENELSVDIFLNSIEDETKRKDSFELIEMMKNITLMEPKMWGNAIVGFGSYDYKYESGTSGKSLRIGFSPRKDSLALYIGAIADTNQDVIQDLGKFKSGKSCLYIKKLTDIDSSILKILIKRGFERKQFGEV